MSEPVGIIYPPPDLKGIVDSTAKYVAKNGGAFEERIMREHKGKPKFSFLFAGDPFNAYYRHKVKETRNLILSESELKQQKQQEDQQEPEPTNRTPGVTSESQNGDREDEKQVPDRVNSPDNRVAPGDYHDDEGQGSELDQEVRDDANDASGIKPKLGEYMQEIAMKIEEPPDLKFLANPASCMTHLESDIVKLTSQFIATYGRPFLLELVSREQSSSHFDFLKPQHGQFPYMTNLIMQFALILNAPLDILDQLEKDSTSQKHVLSRIKARAEWTRVLEKERQEREEAEKNEKILYSEIDWHDFVIVETLDFQPDEKGAYPPTTPDQVGARLLLQQRNEDHIVPEEMEIDMDVDSDNSAGSDDGRAGQEFAVPDPPDLSKVVIRRDYDPKAATKTIPQPDSYFVSPITSERIPSDKINEYVRYNLTDPRYLEKKEQMLQEKIHEEDVFASGSQIQDSLKNLAERRTDIFGMNDEETDIGRRINEEEQEQGKDSNKIIWDGHKSSLKKKKLS